MADHPHPTRSGAVSWAVLVICGLCWGMTGPMSKVAVSTGHHPVGITFWGAAVAALAFSVALALRREWPPINRRLVLFFLGCGFLGTALPNSLSYEAYRHLPVGVNVMVLSLVPMATLLIAAPLGVERLDPRRAAGLALGVVAVGLIMGPDTALPDAGQAIWVALPVIVAISYAGENIFIAALKPGGVSTLSVMWGLSVGGLALTAPVAFSLGAVFDISALGAPEQAVLASAGLHLIAYFGFVWLIDRAGPVFASQVGYVVTAVGVLMGMALFGERHSVWVWSALALMMVGLSLVKPRDPGA